MSQHQNQNQNQNPEPEPEPEPLAEFEEATVEQLEKLNQLQKQIRELENISHQHTFSQKRFTIRKINWRCA